MTADLYATAAGLIERSAAAYVPEDAGDDGFFWPASVTWRVSADLAAPVAALRSLLMQALHPLAMTGVDQHSGWRRDPVGRLAGTMAYLATVTLGERAAAMRAAARVRRIHDHVPSTDAVTGQPYLAGDPALLLWVHGTLVDSVLAAGGLVGTALSAADSNRYVAEMVTAAELTGVPRPLVPSNVPELDLYIASVRPTLRCTPAAAESMTCLLDPPGLDEGTAQIWQDVRDAAIAVLPRWARQMYGCGAPPSLTPGRRIEIRQSLGVLDTMLVGQPGVLGPRRAARTWATRSVELEKLLLVLVKDRRSCTCRLAAGTPSAPTSRAAAADRRPPPTGCQPPAAATRCAPAYSPTGPRGGVIHVAPLTCCAAEPASSPMRVSS